MLSISRRSSHALLARGRRRLLLGAGGMAVSLAMLPGQAMAGTYTASTEAELQTAIANANADADASATITLTANIALSNGAPPAATKPITIDTGIYTLSGVYTDSTRASGGTLQLNNANYTLVGTILGAADPSGSQGMNGITVGGGVSVVNNASITAGAGASGTNYGVGALVSNGSLTNNGTITGGSAGNATTGGVGVALTVNGGTLINNGTIQGGAGSTGGVAVSTSGTTIITNSGTIKGGNGAAAITGSATNITITNSGTISADPGSTAIDLSSATGATLTLQAGSSITGNVVASTATNAVKNLVLGGATDASFDTTLIGSQYKNFNFFQKSGTSTWTLNGGDTSGRLWTINQGTLKTGSGDYNFGTVYNSGTLEFGGNGTSSVGILTGSGSLVQSGSGTTTITNSNNNYTGGTFITGGTLVVIYESGLGDNSSGLTLNGGTLKYSSIYNASLARTFTLGDNGGTIDVTNGSFQINNALTGAGKLTTADGTVILAADNSYTGGTTITSGFLQIGTGGTTGSIVGDVTDNGQLSVNRSSDWTYSGVISGSGNLYKSAAGTLTLTGINSYTGTTSVAGGTLLLSGGQITNSSGLSFNGGGALIVDGSNALFNSGNAVSTSMTNGTSLTVRNGGTASLLGNITTQATSNSTATISVSDAGSTLTLGGTLSAGLAGTTTVNVLNGGSLTTNGTVILGGALFPAQGVANVTVSGTGSQWAINNGLTYRRGALTISNGGVVTATSAALGNTQVGATNPATVLVTGAGSKLVTTGALALASASTNANGAVSLTIGDSGTVTAGSGTLDMSSGYNTLNIGAASGSTAVGSGTLNASSVVTNANSTINFNHTDTGYTFASLISGAGALNQLSGTTILTGNNSYTGATTISGGVLRINGDQSAATGLTTVASGATLGGSGIIGGSVSVADGGILAPGNSPGTLTINGNLALSSGSLLNYELGQANTVGGSLNDLTVVKGNLTLDGTINVTVPAGGTFGPGLYRVISYGGTLTDNGLSLGTLPSGSSVTVQTSVAGQVNLINTGGQTLNFWDGTGAQFNNQIDGGSGTWQASAGNSNWANSTGAVNAAYTNGAMAIFSGTPGTVTIDNSLGAVTASGLQFATAGYTLSGGALTLTGPQSTIRVGDGTAAGAGYTATISAPIQGSTQLVKTDLGTLVLTGSNTYTGGTEIDRGILSVNNNGNLGDAAGAITVNGGTLQWTGSASYAPTRTVNWGTNGGGINVTNSAVSVTIGNGLVGGALTKGGAGKLTLTGDNIFNGGVTINQGTMQLGSGSAATLTGNIVDNGSIAFNTTNDWTYTGSITGTGSINSLVYGTLTFTGNSSYSGGTTISGGNGTYRYLGNTVSTGATSLTNGNIIVDAGATYNTASVLARSTTSGPSTVSVVNGGVLNTTGAFTLQTALGTTLASLNVSGAGSQLNVGGAVVLGASAASNNFITIGNGGKVTTGGATTMGTTAGNTTLPSITIDGTGTTGSSDWTSQGALTMNDGTLSLTNGGTATFTGITAGTAATVPATILVSGSGSSLTSTGDLTVGSGSGSGVLTLQNGGAATVGGTLVLGGASTATGTLNIGAASGSAAVGAGTLNTSSVVTNANSAMNFNHTDTGYTFAALVSGAGALNQLAGTTILTGNNSYTGATTISGGVLRINGDQSAATGLTSVASGATLGGSGIVGGDVTVADGGAIAPGNSPGTLTINGNLSLSGGSLLNYEIGQANVVGGSYNDLTIVKGNLTLDGTINVTVPTGGTFGPGLYRVISYNGALTDNGLALGTMPAGSDVSVQTSVANQVNLINTGGQTLSFWDGAAGPKFNNQVDGGNGIWQASAGNNNWANATGAVNAGYSDGSLAIFAGTPGTVTIDNSLGAVTASGLQFASDGYVLTGDALTLTGPQSMIRVGDGTSVGAGFTTTIDAVIQGNAQLVKSDVGTLVLTGANTYTGGTEIDGGTLRIANDGNLGAAAGGLSFNGGTLSTSADLATARTVSLIDDGAVAPDAGTTLTLNGLVSGSGGLFQNGSGTLILNGANSYTGATTVGAGTLLVNGNQSAATGLTSVANGATLGGTGTIGGDVTLADGATLSPGTGTTAGTLTINGNLSLSSGSVLNYQLGQAGVAGGALNDLVNVGGKLVLDGTLNVSVTSGGTFDPGIYRLFNYGGTLTDNGLTLGSMPGGSAVTVQTSVAGQVNLVNTNGLLLSYWDGAGNGKNNDLINGGNGLWQSSAGNDNWTTPSGNVNAPNATDSFAIFAGTAGTVTVDNSLGAVSASGLQFATSGYRINGATLTLTGPQSIIRVGDGTSAGAAYTATIDAVLAGSTQLVKSDAGTLILTAANQYTDGTSINGGTLQIASDANLGAATGGVTLNGGTLSTTADLVSARSFDVADTSGITTANASTLTLTGGLTGSGALTKNGLGTLLIAGDGSSYSGTATVAAGTLGVTGTLGGSVAVSSGASLVGTGQVGTVTNAGSVSPGLNGSFGTLTVNGTYTGANGTLAIKTALGGDASRSDLLVVNGSTAGNTVIKVTNIGGGGAATVNGIKVVDVTGASNGTFTLAGNYLFDGQQAVVAGAYGYRLYKNGVNTADGDWYLRSSLLDGGSASNAGDTSGSAPAAPLYQPGVPVYEAYSQTLLALNDLGTMQQRIGDRQWMQGGDRQSGLWQRFEGQGLRANAAQSSSLAHVGVDIWKVEVGADQVLSQRADGSALVLGVVAGYGEATSNVGSIYGNGSIKTSAYSLGGTLSWFGPQGFYIDGRAQVNWYDSRLTSSVLGSLVDGNKGRGEAYSLEIGKRWPVGGHLSVTPQVQMVYSTIGFDGFTDPNGASVTSRLGDSLKSRWGISLDRQDGSSHLYAVASLSYEWLNGTVTDVSGAAIGRETYHLWGEAGVGANVVLGRGFSIFAQASGETAAQDIGKSYGWKGNAGFRLAF
ncbi:autotransporter outer membrane beta-barrel domain-containing protein [Novosphingobium terrae]|uniref:autotransporter outer membrane beta-barrel domain-containing protein n=1 Tax=Novosphingobium terrae TaxID=2726189 RepID=UPI001981343E|nr:autotransporter outer membrane beta-barrel domain-containing protein [Novosphingobium terrae]